MAFCPECNAELKEGASFCGKCGTTINNENVGTSNQPKMNHTAPANPVFVEGDETTVASLGNGVLKNMVTGGGLSSLNATLTEKRLYVSGKCLDHTGLGWRYSKISRIIDIEDVTGTGFVYITKPILIFLAFILTFIGVIGLIATSSGGSMMGIPSYSSAATIIPFLCIIIGIIFFIIHFLTKKNIFQIEYAGGRIGFDVKWIRADVATDFQKQIHYVKKLKKEADRVTN